MSVFIDWTYRVHQLSVKVLTDIQVLHVKLNLFTNMVTLSNFFKKIPGTEKHQDKWKT